MIYFDIRHFSAQKHFQIQSRRFLLTAKDLYFRSKNVIMCSTHIRGNTNGGDTEEPSICAEATSAVWIFPITSPLIPQNHRALKEAVDNLAVYCSEKTVCFNYFNTALGMQGILAEW